MVLVDVEHLSVAYGRKRPVMAVRDVSLQIREGEFVGLVGESGSGKSTLGFSIARLESSPAWITGGDVTIAGERWTGVPLDTLRPHRWTQVAVVLQSGMNALNPVITVASQFRDVFREHTGMSRADIRSRSMELLEMVKIPRRFLTSYPHELSGGMKQRIAIALAFALRPKFVIMDEPTTALDVVVQMGILQNLMEMRREHNFALLFISHDLGTVAQLADRIAVMYAGQIVESQSVSNLLASPRHPYTQAILDVVKAPVEVSTGRFKTIGGSPPDMRVPWAGCAFAKRCLYRQAVCEERAPALRRSPEGEARCHLATGEE